MELNPQNDTLIFFYKELLTSTYCDEIITKKALNELLNKISKKQVKDLIGFIINDNSKLMEQYELLLSQKEKLQKSNVQSTLHSIINNMNTFLDKKNDGITLLYGIVFFLQQIIHHNIAIYESIVRLSKKINNHEGSKVFRLHLDNIYENDEKLLILAYQLE
ncbi:DUF892 family protein [Aquimarina sp. U1-2]|uniref:DUF892 family protein n=1 Tax=Aquimarina sp. U1-2 TaxID=2823141 RepID=UPI001AEC899B|nr:DUF892 family protein [Aquimarina sp. U1-2]MBP2833687.1 DUF892 family protein [Aquimarina sp. U1-2]